MTATGPVEVARSRSEPGPGGARQRRRRWALAIGVAAVVLATGGVVAFSRLDGRPPAGAATAAAPTTAVVKRTDLVEHIEAGGTVGYGRTSPLVGRKPGTLTWLPTPGSVIGRGGRLYGVGAVPVPLLFGDMPMYRELATGVPDGPDVLILQRNLAALGYDPGPTDGRFGASTTKALRRWQKALTIPVTGRLAPDDVVVLPGAVRVDSVVAQLADSATGPILKVTNTARVVSVTLDEARRRFAKLGAKATVELANGAQATGTIRTVETTSGGSNQQPKINIAISFDDASVASTADAGPISVRFSGASRTGVLAVPVEALLALREGGYAVEVVDNGHRLVAVTLGLFADGLVEVSGAGLSEGATVVTSS